MDPEAVKKYVGKRCRIVLLNNFNYTGVIPEVDTWFGNTFTLRDKFNEMMDITCEMIGMIIVLPEDEQ